MRVPVERGVLETPPEEELALMCAQGHADRVQELLEFGIDANHYGEERSYLYLAAENGHSVVVGKLIRAGAHVQRIHLTAAIRGATPTLRRRSSTSSSTQTSSSTCRSSGWS